MPRGSTRRVTVSSKLSSLPMLENGVVTRGEHLRPAGNQGKAKKKTRSQKRDNRIQRVREVSRILKSFKFVQISSDEELWYPLQKLHQEIGGSRDRFARALQDAKDWRICWTKHGRIIYFYPNAVNYFAQNKVSASSIRTFVFPPTLTK